VAIVVKRKGEKARVIVRCPFSAELDLQQLVYNNPELLPISEIKEGEQFLLLDREVPTKSGPIDILGVDSEGEIYVVETKLFRNADKRKVLAQVLDYGAALWHSYQDSEAFLRMLEKRLLQKGQSLRNLLEEHFGDAEKVLDGMRESLSLGKFRFVILMDSVPPDLKNLIRYVNRNTTFSVYIVELEYYVHPDQNIEIFVPGVFGAEIRREVREPGSRQRWDESSFFRDLEERVDPETIAAVWKLYEHAKKRADVINWGTGRNAGSFNPRFLAVADKSIYSVYSDGRLVFNFVWLLEGGLRTRLWTELKKIPCLAPHVPDDLPKRSCVFPAEIWVPVCDEILDLLDRVLAETTSSRHAISG